MKTTITFSRTENHSQFKMAIAKCFLVLLLLFGVNSAFSQVSGDYRSNGVGSAWVTAANWEKYNGTAWAAATDYPGQNSGAGNVMIRFGGSITLDVSPANAIGSLSVGDGTTNGSGISNSAATLSISTFTLVVTGNIIISSANGARNGTLNNGSGTVKMAGALSTASGTYTASTGNFEYNGTTQNIFNTTYYNLLTSNSGVKTTIGATTVNNNLTVGNGTTFVAAAFALTVTGTTTVGAGTSGILTISSATGTKAFNGNVTVNSGATWNNTAANVALTLPGSISNSGTFNAGTGLQTLSGTTKTITGTFSIPSLAVTGTYSNNGTLTVSTGLSGIGTLANTSTLNIQGTSSVTTLSNSGTLAISGSGTITTALANFTNTGTINLSGSGAITGITNNAAGIVNHSGSATVTSFNNATATSSLNISTTPTVPTFTTLTVSTAGNTVTYNGAGAQTVKAVGYSNLTLSGSGAKTLLVAMTTINGSLTMSGTATATGVVGLAIGGNVTIGSGTTFTAGSFTHTVGGNWTNNGATFTPSTSTITFNGVAQTIGGSTSTTFNNLSLSGGTKTFGLATAINGNLSIASGALVNLGSLTTHTAGTLTLGGLGTTGTAKFGSTSTSGTAPVYKNNTYFTAGTTGYITVTSSSCVAPTITFSSIPNICVGSLSYSIPYTSVSGAPDLYSISGTGITSVTNGTLNAPSSSITVGLSSAAVAGTISPSAFTVTSSVTGCVSTNLSGSVTVIAAPNAGADGAVTICAGSTVTLSQLNTAITGEDLGGTWTPALAGAGTYTYTVNATSPCTVADTSVVLVTAQAQPNAGADGAVTICAGRTVTLSQLNAAITGEDVGGTWTPALAGAGTYTYTVNATSPCTVADTSVVVVTELALPIVTASNVSGCSGSSITLVGSGSPAGGSGVYSPSSPFVGSSSTTYTYTYTAPNGCIVTSAPANITITAQPTWYLDVDGDHYYSGSAVSSCTSPGASYTTTGILGGGDCNDSNPAINPGAVEICYNSIDDNCDGTMSEGCAVIPITITSPAIISNFSNSFSCSVYAYAGATSIAYRIEIERFANGVSAGGPVTLPTQTSRFFQIPDNMRVYTTPTTFTTYKIRASAVISGEAVAYAVPVISVNNSAVPTIQLSTCPTALSSIGATISANPGFNATDYSFRIRLNDSNPSPTYYYITNSFSRFVNSNSFVGLQLQFGTSYKVSVSYHLLNHGVLEDAGYGAECTMTTPTIPVTGLSAPACGTQAASLGSPMTASPALYATAYIFRVRLTSDNGTSPTYYYTNELPSRFSQLSAFQGITLSYNTNYSISVQYRMPNGAGSVLSAFGPECSILTPFFPTVEIVCNSGTTGLTQSVVFASYPGFPNYRIKLQELDINNDPIAASTQYIVRNTNNFTLSMFTTFPPTLGKSYNASVAIILGAEQDQFGRVCTITTASGARAVAIKQLFKAVAYPNPFANNFMLDVKTSSESVVNLKVYDMIGRLIEQRDVTVSAIETTSIGDRYPSGVYNVVVSQEDNVQTVRVVKR